MLECDFALLPSTIEACVSNKRQVVRLYLSESVTGKSPSCVEALFAPYS